MGLDAFLEDWSVKDLKKKNSKKNNIFPGKGNIKVPNLDRNIIEKDTIYHYCNMLVKFFK